MRAVALDRPDRLGRTRARARPAGETPRGPALGKRRYTLCVTRNRADAATLWKPRARLLVCDATKCRPPCSDEHPQAGSIGAWGAIIRSFAEQLYPGMVDDDLCVPAAYVLERLVPAIRAVDESV